MAPSVAMKAKARGTPAKLAATLLKVVAISWTMGRRDDTIAWAMSRPIMPPSTVEASESSSELANGTRSSGCPR